MWSSSWVWGPRGGQKPKFGAQNPRRASQKFLHMLSSGSSWVWGPSWGQKPEIGAENPRQVFGRKSLTKAPSKALLGFEGPGKGRSPSLGPKTQEESQEEPHKRSFKASPRGSSWVWGPIWGRKPEIGVENPRRVSIRTSEKFLFFLHKECF